MSNHPSFSIIAQAYAKQIESGAIPAHSDDLKDVTTTLGSLIVNSWLGQCKETILTAYLYLTRVMLVVISVASLH
jgi:hypothetical protein